MKKADFAGVKMDLAIETFKTALEHRNTLLVKSMTIRWGTMLFVAVGVMMAFMKYMQA